MEPGTLKLTPGTMPVVPQAFVDQWFGQGDPATKRWYDANCYCGAVRFRFRYTDLGSSPVNHCDCSICTKNGFLAVYPKRAEMEWLRGRDALSSYRMSTKTMEHKFCPTCGSSVLCDFHWSEETQPYAGDILAVNARMVKDFEDKGLNLREVSSRESYGVPYKLDD